jgi:hypothetical protein
MDARARMARDKFVPFNSLRIVGNPALDLQAGILATEENWAYNIIGPPASVLIDLDQSGTGCLRDCAMLITPSGYAKRPRRRWIITKHFAWLRFVIWITVP